MSGGHQQAGLGRSRNASGSSINTEIPGCTYYRCSGQQVWSGALIQPPEDLRDSWSWESPDQMTEGFLPARGLTVQGLGWDASPLVHWLPWGAQRLAHTLILGHLGTIPLGSKEESDGTPKTSVPAPPTPGAIHMVRRQMVLCFSFSSPSGPGLPPTPAGTGSCGPTAGWQVEAWGKGRAKSQTSHRAPGTLRVLPLFPPDL